MTTKYLKIFRLLPLLLASVTVLAVAATSPDSRRGDVARQKARYYFLKGTVQEAQGNDDAAYEYYKKAYATDPSYPEGGWNYGLRRIGNNNDYLADDSAKYNSMLMASPLVEKYPGDYYTVISYAQLAALADTSDHAIKVLERLLTYRPEKTNTHLYIAQYAENREEYDRAYRALEEYEKAEGPNPQVTMRKGYYKLAQGDTAGMIAEGEKLVRSNPSNMSFYTLKGMMYEAVEMPDSALLTYQKALEIDPESGEVMNMMAEIYKNRGDSVMYDQLVYKSLMSEDLELDDKLSMMAGFLQKLIDDKGDSKKGDRLFDTLKEQYPHEPKILGLSANYQAARGNFKQAMDEMQYVIDLDGQNEWNWLSLMRYQAHDSLYRDAMATFRRAQSVMVNPPGYEMKDLFAGVAMRCDSLQAGKDMYQEMLREVVPTLSLSDSLTNKRPYMNLSLQDIVKLSLIYESAGDAIFAADPDLLPETFRCYHNALFFLPDNALALNNYAYFIIEHENPAPDSERFAQAKSMSERSLKNASDNPTYLDTYAWILFKEKNYSEAKEYQQKAVELVEQAGDLSDSDVFSHYGDILFMAGEPDKAVEAWEKALKISPDDELLMKKVKHRTFFYN